MPSWPFDPETLRLSLSRCTQARLNRQVLADWMEERDRLAEATLLRSDWPYVNWHRSVRNYLSRRARRQFHKLDAREPGLVGLGSQGELDEFLAQDLGQRRKCVQYRVVASPALFAKWFHRFRVDATRFPVVERWISAARRALRRLSDAHYHWWRRQESPPGMPPVTNPGANSDIFDYGPGSLVEPFLIRRNPGIPGRYPFLFSDDEYFVRPEYDPASGQMVPVMHVRCLPSRRQNCAASFRVRDIAGELANSSLEGLPWLGPWCQFQGGCHTTDLLDVSWQLLLRAEEQELRRQQLAAASALTSPNPGGYP